MKKVAIALVCCYVNLYAFHGTITRSNYQMPSKAQNTLETASAKNNDISARIIGDEFKIRFEESGTSAYVRKCFDKKSGSIVTVASDSDGNSINITDLDNREKAISYKRNGDFSKDLVALSSSLRPDDSVYAALWISDKNIGNSQLQTRFWGSDAFAVNNWQASMKSYKKAFENNVSQYRSTIANKLADASKKQNKQFFSPTLTSSKIVPVVKGYFTLSQLNDLKFDTDIALIDVLGNVRIVGDLNVAAYYMYVDNLNYYGYTGSNINVADLEVGFPSYQNQLGLSGVTFRMSENQFSASDRNIDHLAMTMSCIRNRRTYPYRGQGFAYNCNLFVANFPNDPSTPTVIDNAEDAIFWATSNNANVISWSWHVEAFGTYKNMTMDEQYNGNQSYLDRVADYISTNYPFPTICQAAGNIDNGDNTEYVNHKGFNPIVVGQDMETGQISSTSVWRNPNSGQELPHVTACAHTNMSMFEKPDGTAYICPNGGTSLSAALTAGLCADLMTVNSDLRSWPEAVRALVMASATNIDGNSWYNDLYYVDMKDGAGRTNGTFAQYSAANHFGGGQSITGNNGWYSNTYFQGATNYDTIRVYVTSTSQFNVVLSFSARVSGTDFSSETLSDLDLAVYYNGNTVGVSLSGTNPEEVINLTNVSTGTYTIVVRPYNVSTDTYYAVAWSNR